MTLPPQLIKLKRKRDEQPIDTLFLTREGSGDRSATGQDIEPTVKFKRIRNESTLPDHATSKLSVGNRSGTTSTELIPSKNKAAPTAASRNGATGGQPATGILSVPAPTSPQQHQKPKPTDAAAESPSSSPLKARRVFHLSKQQRSTTSGLRRSTSASSLRGIHKRRRPAARGGVIAVFEQQKDKLEKFISATDSTAGLSTVVAQQPSQDGARPSEQKNDDATISFTPATHAHKRPGVSSVERQWRENTWSKPAIVTANAAAKDTHINEAPEDMHDAGDPSLALAAELQQFAMQESKKDAAAATVAMEAETSAPNSVSHPPAHQSRPAKPLKYLPKSPPPRYHERHPETVSQSMILDEDSEGEWVYDTYIREIHDGSVKHPDGMLVDTVPSADAKLATAAAAAGDSIGYLVIRIEDEEIWEEFMSEGDSSDEDKWGEDEEDENAEDYHGNDYPEDEDWSGSGYGSGSNSYDSQGDAWSDEEGNKEGGD